jgi:acyl-coenzyme A thioesterase PaaI-like protein
MIESAAEAMRPGTVATDMQIHYLAQVRSGPARTTGAVLRDAADHSVVTVRLTDAGDDDHVLALATVTLRPAGREIR